MSMPKNVAFYRAKWADHGMAATAGYDENWAHQHTAIITIAFSTAAVPHIIFFLTWPSLLCCSWIEGADIFLRRLSRARPHA